MGQVNRQAKVEAMNEALAWVAASLSWEHRLGELVAEAPATVFESGSGPVAPALAGVRPVRRRRPLPAVET